MKTTKEANVMFDGLKIQPSTAELINNENIIAMHRDLTTETDAMENQFIQGRLSYAVSMSQILLAITTIGHSDSDVGEYEEVLCAFLDGE